MGDTLDWFRGLEESLLDPAVRADADRLASLIADDFVEFGALGQRYGKQDVIDASVDLPDVMTPLKDFAIQWRDDSAAVVTYRSEIAVDGVLYVALRNSLWVLREARWQLRFHQGTPVGDPHAWSGSDASD